MSFCHYLHATQFSLRTPFPHHTPQGCRFMRGGKRSWSARIWRRWLFGGGAPIGTRAQHPPPGFGMPFTDHTGLAGAGGFAGYHAVTIYCTPPSAFVSAPTPTLASTSESASASAYAPSTVLPHPCLHPRPHPHTPAPVSTSTPTPKTLYQPPLLCSPPHPYLHPPPRSPPHQRTKLHLYPSLHPSTFTLHYITHVHLYTRPRIRACLCLHSCFRTCSCARVRVRLSTHLCTRAYAFHRTSASPSTVFPRHPRCASLSPSDFD